jgi:DNA helicase II / ATP-dependent DNA helicase PcrA
MTQDSLFLLTPPALSRLNPNQQKAVEHGEGPLLVLAGAGSGKTRVLVHRIAHLFGRGEAPESFWVSTFTKKAAVEMTRRLAKLIDEPAIEQMTIGTFHSWAYGVLKREYLNLAHELAKFEILREYPQKQMLKGLIGAKTRAYPDACDVRVHWAAALRYIGNMKNKLLHPEDVSVDAENPKQAGYLKLYRAYEDRKNRLNLLDFDDLLVRTHDLFDDHPEVLDKYRRQYKWFLVDEFQDTNHAQLAIMQMLSGLHSNVTVVGDDDQSIYRFRGAKPEYILNFSGLYPGAATVYLEENYRSCPKIVGLASRLIQSNEIRHGKRLVPMLPAAGDPQLAIYAHADEAAADIVDKIRTLLYSGTKGGDIAILYRTNAQSRALEDVLVQASIPYTIIGSCGFYARREIRDMLAYLKVLVDPRDREALSRIINVPTRYLGAKFLRRVFELSDRTGGPAFDHVPDPVLKDKQKAQALKFYDLMLELARTTLAPAEMIKRLRVELDYDKWLLNEDGESEDGASFRIENLDELERAAGQHETISDFLAFTTKQQSQTKGKKPSPKKVQLMTLHAAKGLEKGLAANATSPYWQTRHAR